MALALTSMGMLSSVGHDVVTACAALRAGLVRPAPVIGTYVLDLDSGEMVPVMGHPDYSRRVRFMLRLVINQYKRLVKQKLSEAHPAPPDALAKEQVERISETVYKAITKAGPFMKGKSLDELRFAGLGGR